MRGRPFERIIVIVLDGVGIGALPDAPSYGDAGADTLGNLAARVGGLSLPALESLGLGTVAAVEGVAREAARGAAGRMIEVSAGKDSTTGHWELAGLAVHTPFPTFPSGFPPEVVRAFESRTGRGVLGNRPASGTVIIEELGPEHLESGRLILYTSADSVFQLAAHEDVVPRETLYGYCRQARELLDGMGLPVLRVIARPFSGRPGGFARAGRRDFSLPPPGRTVLDALRETGWPVMGIGKVGELFCQRGFDLVRRTQGNREGMEEILRAVRERPRGVVMANLLDFDTLHGHRNDPAGFADALAAFDLFLGCRLLPSLGRGDLLMITADHGCDPTMESTDHNREYVPILVDSPSFDGPLDLGTRGSFADVAATIFEALEEGRWERGRSFFPELSALIRAGGRRSPGESSCPGTR